MMEIWVIVALLAAAGWVGKAMADSTWIGPWEYRLRHSCGFRETFGRSRGQNRAMPHIEKACPRCGGTSGWSQSLCSYNPFIGWREKDAG
jgi:hypothetical protein